jgi:hypothetical protein
MHVRAVSQCDFVLLGEIFGKRASNSHTDTAISRKNSEAFSEVTFVVF